MRLSVIYDDAGTIVAAGQIGDGADQVVADQVVPDDGEHRGEFDVPAELAGEELHDIVSRTKVDVERKALVVLS